MKLELKEEQTLNQRDFKHNYHNKDMYHTLATRIYINTNQEDRLLNANNKPKMKRNIGKEEEKQVMVNFRLTNQG